ncbi:glucose-1-phosphate cytidylyltransferase [archaeon]|nr:glucose-1-phosphate cytidylyltransferase [archaeon]
MPVVILCGGYGTRMGRATQDRPKPLVEIGDDPILLHIMKVYSHHGFNDFTLCLGYNGEMIKKYFIDYKVLQNDLSIGLGSKKGVEIFEEKKQENWIVNCINTGIDTPTGGRIHRIKNFIRGKDFMVTYGDGVSNINIKDLLEYHHTRGKIATVTAVRPPARFGELEIEDGLVKSFSKGEQMKSGWIDGGFFVFNKGIFEYLNDDSWLSGDVKEEKDGPNSSTLQKLISDEELVAYQHGEFWGCMDNPRDLKTLTKMWKSGKAKWDPRTNF